MTPAERAVIDAARALEPVVDRLLNNAWAGQMGELCACRSDVSALERASRPFLAAVRALPRPLSEQLAELRPGAVVEFLSEDAPPVTVLCPDAESQTYFGWYITKSGKRRATVFGMGPDEAQYIRRIISNPEASDGR